MTSTHTLELSVRDYELDMQGVVNNSVYGNYFEHARHEFLLSNGVDFAKLANEGIHLVVARIEIDYKRALKSGDGFRIETSVSKSDSKVKFEFAQAILTADNQLAAKAKVVGVAVDAKKQRPMRLESIPALFDASAPPPAGS